MKNSLFTLFLLLASTLYTFGQYGETIRTGRPGQAIGAFSVGKKVLQVQSGIYYNQISNQDIDNDINSFSNTTVIRYGITELVELSTLWGFNNVNNSTTDLSSSGISASQIGLRFHISENKGWIPATCFQFRVRTNWLSKDFKRSDPGAKFIVAAKHKLTDGLGLVTNWSMSWAGATTQPSHGLIFNLSFGINDKLGGFVEHYSTISNGYYTPGFDVGLGYLINKDLQLDAYTGVNNFRDGVFDYFIGLGVSWRTLFRRSTMDD